VGRDFVFNVGVMPMKNQEQEGTVHSLDVARERESPFEL
jgi:hypothetical protein